RPAWAWPWPWEGRPRAGLGGERSEPLFQGPHFFVAHQLHDVLDSHQQVGAVGGHTRGDDGLHFFQRAAHAVDSRRGEHARQADALDAECLEFRDRDEGCSRPLADAEAHVDADRDACRLYDAADVFRRLDRVGKDHVGARCGVGLGAARGAFDAFNGQRIRARDDDEAVVAPRQAGRLDLLHHFFQGDHILARHVAAALGADLVLDVDAGDAGFLEHAYGMEHIHRIAVARIGVGGQRDIYRTRQHAAMIDVFGQAHYADVGNAEQGVGQGGPAGARRLEPRGLHQPQAVAVVDAWRDNEFSGVEQIPEFLGGGCHGRGFPLYGSWSWRSSAGVGELSISMAKSVNSFWGNKASPPLRLVI